MTTRTVSRKFIEKWAKIFLEKFDTVGEDAAMRWVNDFLNEKDYTALADEVTLIRLRQEINSES